MFHQGFPQDCFTVSNSDVVILISRAEKSVTELYLMLNIVERQDQNLDMYGTFC